VGVAASKARGAAPKCTLDNSHSEYPWSVGLTAAVFTFGGFSVVPWAGHYRPPLHVPPALSTVEDFLGLLVFCPLLGLRGRYGR
jgi:hypothetical protein